MGGFSEDCGLKGVSTEFGAWIYGVEVLLKLVELIFPGGTVDIINIP